MTTASHCQCPASWGSPEATGWRSPAHPDDFRQALGALPNGVAVRTRVRGPLDVIVAFLTRRSELKRRFPPLAAALQPDGGLWIAWPKRSSGVTTDLTEDVVREIAIANGMVDNKVLAGPLWLGVSQSGQVPGSLQPCISSGAECRRVSSAPFGVASHPGFPC